MTIVPNLPKKVHFLTELSFSIHAFLPWKRTFDGGRKGYDKTLLFLWLLIKKIVHWDYRTIADMAGVSHSTLVRANTFFLQEGVYEKFFRHLVKVAYKNGLIQGKKVSLDSSFVKTFSKRQEYGSGGWNGHKEAHGFKLHLLIDAHTSFPLALIVGDGVTHDSQVAVPLLKRARPWLKKCGYVLADKGYDDVKIVEYIAKKLKAKAGIPLREGWKNKKGRKSGNSFNWKSKATGRTVKKSIYRLRSGIERTFSTLKRTYHLGHEHTRGIFSFMKNVWLTLISYMLRKFYTEGSTCF
jgi:transposase